jgi:hypothetical protein
MQGSAIFGSFSLQPKKEISVSIREAIQAEREEIVKAIEHSNNLLLKALGLPEEPAK